MKHHDGLSTRGRVAAALTVVVVACVVAALVVVLRDKGSASPADVVLTAPSAAGATYSIDFGSPSAVDQLAELRRFTSGRIASPARIGNSQLAQGTVRTTGATYFERRSDTTCGSIGVRGTMPDDSPGTSAIVLLLTDGPIPQDARVDPMPNVMAHVAITRAGWDLGVWPKSATTLQTVQSNVGEASGEDVDVAYEIQWRGDTVTVVDSSGTSTTVQDKRFASATPKFATWELYQEGAGAKSPSIQSWWTRCQ